MLRNFSFSGPLEKQFGKLRLWSGETYFLAVQQILLKAYIYIYIYIYKTKLLLKLNKEANLLGNPEPRHEGKR